MWVEHLPLASLRPYPGNPRQQGDAVAKVAESLRTFGWRQPIVVDADRTIVVGHVRYEAALRLGLETAPVHVAADLTPDQARVYRLMDNRSHEEASRDREALAAELAALEAADVALGLTGFEALELRELLAFDLFAGETDDDEAPAAEARRARIQPGDLLELGPHRLLCGDSTSRADVTRLIDA
jgi:ParB-like chromosome segregation protein Spo0J